jgi:hypothetical protein
VEFSSEKCSACGAALDWADVPPPEEYDWVELFSTLNQTSLLSVRALLEAEEVDFVVVGELSLTLLAPIDPARILVLRRDLQLAKELIAELELNSGWHV